MRGRLVLFIAIAFAVSCDPPTEPPVLGRVLWVAAGHGWGTPAFDSSNVYFVGFNHDLVAVDRSDGALRWRRVTTDPGTTTQGRTAVVAGSVVAIGDINIFAYDRVSGQTKWTFKTLMPGYLGLASDGTGIFAGSPYGFVFRINALNGAVDWSARLPSDTNAWMSHPVYDAGRVYLCVAHKNTSPYTGGVAAFDALDGDLIWYRDFPASDASGPTNCHNLVTVIGDVVIAPSEDGSIYAFSRVDGTLVFTRPPSVSPAALAAADSAVFAGNTDGDVRAIHASSGAELWTVSDAESFGSITYPLAADTTQVYAVYAGGQLVVFDGESGAELWTSGTNGEYLYTPAIDGDRLYVGGSHGLYALRAK